MFTSQGPHRAKLFLIRLYTEDMILCKFLSKNEDEVGNTGEWGIHVACTNGGSIFMNKALSNHSVIFSSQPLATSYRNLRSYIEKVIIVPALAKRGLSLHQPAAPCIYRHSSEAWQPYKFLWLNYNIIL